MGIGVFQDPDLAAGLADPAELRERGGLPVGLQDAEQEAGDDGVEGVVGKRGAEHVHLQELDLLAEALAPPRGPGQHGRAQVDADDRCACGIERHVAAGADAGVQDGPGQALEHAPP